MRPAGLGVAAAFLVAGVVVLLLGVSLKLAFFVGCCVLAAAIVWFVGVIVERGR